MKTKAVDDDDEEDEDEEEEEDKQNEKKPEVFALLVLGYVTYQIQCTVTFVYPIMKISVLLVVIFFKLKHDVMFCPFHAGENAWQQIQCRWRWWQEAFCGESEFPSH